MNRTTSPRPAYFTRLALFLLTALAALTLLGFSARQAQATPITYHVATDGNDNNDGLTWATAKQHVQAGINVAHSGDQVWVKAGVYIGNFTAVDGVAVYGHFVGTETMLSQRDFANSTPTYTSYLDGNNSGTVYTIPSAAIKPNTLDGFTVEYGGNAGLIDQSNDNLIVSNCVFKNNDNNYNSNYGGGIYDDGLTGIFTNCTFVDNTAFDNGGALYIGNNTTATVNSCVFMDNDTYYTSYNNGGGVYSA